MMHRTNQRLPHILVIILLISTALFLAACGNQGAAPAASNPAPTAAPVSAERVVTTAAGGFPLTIENCGLTQTYAAPPQRAVTMNQHVTEVMLALGLQDRMVGPHGAGV